MARPDRSVVIPVYQEVESVPRLHEALARMGDASPGGWEFIFVDDGSRDGTWEALGMRGVFVQPIAGRFEERHRRIDGA